MSLLSAAIADVVGRRGVPEARMRTTTTTGTGVPLGLSVPEGTCGNSGIHFMLD